MNPDNVVHLNGTVRDAPWTSYGRGQHGRVNFWLAVSRELAGDGVDLVQCAIEQQSAGELVRLQHELHDGRTVHLLASARSLVREDAALTAQTPGVVFIVHDCGLDGAAPRNAHQLGKPRRHHAHGKMAAAGDDLELLTMEDAR